MAVKLADTLAPMGDFEIAEAKDISVNIGGTKKMLQKAIEDGDIGGASDIVVKCTEDQYGALLPDQKALNIIYCTEKNLYYHDEAIVPVVDTTPITDSIGSLESLKTTEKNNLVGAINEVSDSLVDIEDDLGVLGESVDGLNKRISPSVFLNTGNESKTLKFTELLQYLIDNNLYDITKSQHKLIALRTYDIVYWTFTDDVNTSSPLTAINSKSGYIEINTYRDGQTWRDGGFIRVGNSRAKRVWEYNIGSRTLYELAIMDSRNIVFGTDVFSGGTSEQVKNGNIVSLQLQIWGKNAKTGRTVLATNLYKPINKVKPTYFFDDKSASDEYNLQITTSGELVALNGFSSNTCFINVSYITSE